MADVAVQSPERSTDDLLAFYNRLISKAKSLNEDQSMEVGSDDDQFELDFPGDERA